jgi:hypothetical protein
MILYVVMYMAEQAHYDEIVYSKSYKPYYIYIMKSIILNEFASYIHISQLLVILLTFEK